MEMFSLLKRFFLKNLENYIIYILWGLTLLLIIDSYLSPTPITAGLQNNVQILLTNAQILATILAITLSFTIFGFQLVSDLNPKILIYYIKSKDFISFFGYYVFGIISNILVASFPNNIVIDSSKFLIISNGILLICLILLLVYLLFIIRGIQPISIINNIGKNIPSTFDEVIIRREERRYPYIAALNDPFIELEQITIRSIRKNDYFSFVSCLRVFANFNFVYLKRLNNLPTDQGYRYIWGDTIALQNYFLRIYDQILIEILVQNNERFLNEYVNYLVKVTEYLYNLKCDHAIEAVEKDLEDIGKEIIDRKYYRSIRNYLSALEKIIDTEFSLLPSGANSFYYDDNAPDINAMSEKEKDLVYFDDTLLERFFAKLSFFVKLAGRVQTEEFNYIFFNLNHKIEELMIESFKKDFNEKLRMWMIRSLLINHLQIHEITLKNKAHSDRGLDHLFMYISRSPKDCNILPIKSLIISYYSEIAELSLKYDDSWGLSGIGVASRVSIRLYPAIASELVDIMINCSKRLRQKGKEKITNINIQDIRQELVSIERQNKDGFMEITNKIDEELRNIDIFINDSNISTSTRS
jgi:hypothetical protein